MLPNTTCSPSKKFSPMTMTMAPPVVQPSLGLMALIHGVAGRESEARVILRVSMHDVHRLKDQQTEHDLNLVFKVLFTLKLFYCEALFRPKL